MLARRSSSSSPGLLLLLLLLSLGGGCVWSRSPASPTSSTSSPTSLPSSSSPQLPSSSSPLSSSLPPSSSSPPSLSSPPLPSSLSSSLSTSPLWSSPPSLSLSSSSPPSLSLSSSSPPWSTSLLSPSSPPWSTSLLSPLSPPWSTSLLSQSSPLWSTSLLSPSSPPWSTSLLSPLSPPWSTSLLSPSSPSSPSSPPVCGCWGNNKVYLQYKAPATGWYTTTTSKHLYWRNITISGRKVQYVLEYKNKRTPTYWVLFENRTDGQTIVISNRKEKKILVSCPSRCACQKVSVEGTACWAINGNYTRRDILEDPYFFIERSMRTKQSAPKNKTKSLSVLEQSNCLLSEIAKCIESEGETNGQSSTTQEDSTTKVEDGCQQHIQVLTKSSQHGSEITVYDTRHHQAYIIEGTKRYILQQADEEDFWWIVDDTDVYAVSEDAGPCPDKLSTDSKWISVEDMQTDPNISVTCIAWDSPED